MKIKQFPKSGRRGGRSWAAALMTAAILMSAVCPVSAAAEAAPAADGETEPAPVSPCLSTLEKRLKAAGRYRRGLAGAGIGG